MPNTHRLTWPTALLLMLPPLLWAGNAVVGRLAAHWIPPITFNYLRWVIAFALLLPFAWRVLLPSSVLWQHWKRVLVLGMLGVGGYNTLQYLALQTSTPMNVTLVSASMPVWMLLTGRLFFDAPITRQGLVGAGLSLLGVATVISQGNLAQLAQVQLVPGDAWMVCAAIVWAVYSWMLSKPKEPAELRGNWAVFLLAQMAMGLVWSSLMVSGEWIYFGAFTDTSAWDRILWSWPLVAVLIYVALGPSLVAYRCWGAGVAQAGPQVAVFFANLTPLFAAVLSSAFLGETPKGYHFAAFGLIIAGIVVSSRKR